VRVRSPLRFRAVTVGTGLSCALDVDGRAHCWGFLPRAGDTVDVARRGSRTPVPVAPGLTFSTLAAGVGYACGVAPDGVAWCWGDNEWGQLGDGTTTASVQPVRVAGEARFRSLAVTRFGGRGVTCGLDLDGAVWCWGSHSEALGRHDLERTTVPGRVATPARFRALSVAAHVCALATADDVYCWGSNLYGQLGDGTVGGARITPRVVPREE
jgi:alpha-tubulin suppressor-like RCC1 family protein